jgi:hypothetical protein
MLMIIISDFIALRLLASSLDLWHRRSTTVFTYLWPIFFGLYLGTYYPQFMYSSLIFYFCFVLAMKMC